MEVSHVSGRSLREGGKSEVWKAHREKGEKEE